jgi:hypothetical protein
MANARRGEIAATIAGTRYTLCLTLGSLAELEDAFGVEDLSALAGRFASGRLSARDLTRILGAGLRGGGHPVSDDEVGALPVLGSLTEIADTVARLLAATFAEPGADGSDPPDPPLPQPA